MGGKLQSLFYKSVLPATLTGMIAGWSVYLIKEKQQEELSKLLQQEQKVNKNLTQKNVSLYNENMVFHRHGFNKRLVEKWITIYSTLREFVPYTNEKLNQNCMKEFIQGMNRKQDLLQWMYSSEYEHYKARQVLPGQSLQYIDKMKNDLYTLSIEYDTGIQDIREDMMALIAEWNFKSSIQEHYTEISFHELFALARTILTNIRQPLNTYSLEQREHIIDAIIQQRKLTKDKELVSSAHTMVNLVGKDAMFTSTQSIINLYKTLTPQKDRHLYQFRDHDFSEYWNDSNDIYTSIDHYLEQAGQEQRPYTILLANHGGIQSDKTTGKTILVDGKLYLEPQGLMKLLHTTHNTAHWVSNIQFLHCHANNSALPLVKLLEQSNLSDTNLPIVITQSDSYETTFGNASDPTPYKNYLNFSKKDPLRLASYYKAHTQPLGFNASIYVPYAQWITSQEWEQLEGMMKYKKYIQQY